MTYTSLLAHVCPGHDNSNVYSVSAQLAEMFDAEVLGVSGKRLTPPFSEVAVADIMQIERESAEQSLKNLESEFREALQNRNIRLSWRARCNYAPVSDFVAEQARAGHLIVTSPESESFVERLDETHLGPLALKAGRPLLVVPREQRHLNFESVAIAWKDAREARRAVADAVPLLKKAKSVSVVQVCAADEITAVRESAEDVAHWLSTQGIAAQALIEAWDESEMQGLNVALRRGNYDLVVAGAYGRTRLNEWVFGGATKDLWLSGHRCVFLSH